MILNMRFFLMLSVLLSTAVITIAIPIMIFQSDSGASGLNPRNLAQHTNFNALNTRNSGAKGTKIYSSKLDFKWGGYSY
ncbi:hypothetical protein DFH28DRAFT_269563 [Melampsora americana]|nr:hypothetical protein DFH28DRAFT_269563 [Melampsora americana]